MSNFLGDALNISAKQQEIQDRLEAWINGGPDCRQECRELAAEIGFEEETEKLIARAQEIKRQREAEEAALWQARLERSESRKKAEKAAETSRALVLRRLGPAKKILAEEQL